METGLWTMDYGLWWGGGWEREDKRGDSSDERVPK